MVIPYFYTAEISKAIVVVLVGSQFLSKIFYSEGTQPDFHSSISLDYVGIVEAGEYYRCFIYPLSFESTGELFVGLTVLTPLLRRFEREMGSRKFFSFIFLKMIVIATLLQLLSFKILPFNVRAYAPGPYPHLGCLLYLFHVYAPSLHPNFFGFFGFNFSDKALTYAACLYLMLNGGLASAIPTFCGYLGGLVSDTPKLPLAKLDFSDNMYSLAANIIQYFGFIDRDGQSSILPGRRGLVSQRNVRNNNNRQRLVPPPGLEQPQFQPMPTPPPPDPASIEQLTSMGFEREAVIAALKNAHNNVEAAANLLLSGTS